jgi:hypothetical protein
MAFCNSCGATLNDGAQFCNKCGAAAGTAAAPPSAASYTAPPPSKSSSSTLKVILIIVGVIVLLGILGIITLGVVAHRMLKGSRITQNGDNVKVETPFGTMETNKNPEQAAKDLGVDIYPGSQIEPSGSASTTFGGLHTAVVKFTSADSVAKVCSFYSQNGALQPSTVTSTNNHCTVVSNHNNANMVTINIDSAGGGSKFQITSVSKKSATPN